MKSKASQHTVLSWTAVKEPAAGAACELTVSGRYLNLPVKNGAAKRWVSLLSGGKVERDFEIELADCEPDWWAFIDLAQFRGRKITVRVDGLAPDSMALRAIELAQGIKGAGDLYREELRPQFHFSARRGWNNDPNGLVYYAGEYHLFFQHNPYGWNWGNMHWGHAVSQDLVSWTELDDAICPDALGTIFSGSAVVDEGDTSGLSRSKDKAIVCVYTAAGGTSRMSAGIPFSQCLAYSTDRGRTWAKYAGNPVLPHIVGSNRDPKVVWYPAGKKWLLALYLDGNDYALFESPDLKSWQRICDVKLPGDSECPEFFEIRVRGGKDSARWIFYGGKGTYLIGRFDGKMFTPESGPHQLNFGNCFYASQTFNNVPGGRRILMPWGQVSMPGMAFNQMIGLPVELTLVATDEGLRLAAMPVSKMETLRQEKQAWRCTALSPGTTLTAGVDGGLFEAVVELKPGTAAQIVLKIHGTELAYDAGRQELACGNSRGTLRPLDGRIRLRVLADRVSLDIFGNDGRLYMPMQFRAATGSSALEMSALGGDAEVVSLEVYRLKPAWPGTASPGGTR